MQVTRYRTVNGQILQSALGPGVISYVPDALGSVGTTSGYDGVNALEYTPYGQAIDPPSYAPPSFQWVGTYGYKFTGRQYSEYYVRARHYSNQTAVWTTRDRYRYQQDAYAYADGNSTTFRDSTGLSVQIQPSCSGDDFSGVADLTSGCCSKLASSVKQQPANNLIPNINSCLQKMGFKPNFGSDFNSIIGQALKNASNICDKTNVAASSSVCLACNTAGAFPTGCNPCKSKYGMDTVSPLDNTKGFPISPSLAPGCSAFNSGSAACSGLTGPSCSGAIAVCATNYGRRPSSLFCESLLHETLHVGGLSGPPSHNNVNASQADRKKDFIYSLACCLCSEMYGGPTNCFQCKVVGYQG